MPVKDAELFTHLLNCPGAEVRQAEWAAEQAAPKSDAKPETEEKPEMAVKTETEPETQAQ